MKAVAALVLPALFVISTATPARAQFSALGKIKKGADKAADAKQKYDDWNITDAEERQLGEAVSMKLRGRFGVMQDAAVTKYVTLVGSVLAQGSTRPALEWKFIVLDTDGVNAYAAPGGIHPHHARPARPAQERGGAGGRARPRNHARHREAHHRRNQAGQGARHGRRRRGQERGPDDRARWPSWATRRSRKSSPASSARRTRTRPTVSASSSRTKPATRLPASPRRSRRCRIATQHTTEQNGLFASHPGDQGPHRQDQQGDQVREAHRRRPSSRRATSRTSRSTRSRSSEVTIDVSGAAGLASGDEKKADEKNATTSRKTEEEGRPGQHHRRQAAGIEPADGVGRRARRARRIVTRRAAATRTRSTSRSARLRSRPSRRASWPEAVPHQPT